MHPSSHHPVCGSRAPAPEGAWRPPAPVPARRNRARHTNARHTQRARPGRSRRRARAHRLRTAVTYLLIPILACSCLLTGIGPWAAAVAAAATRPAGAGVTTIDQALGCTRTVEETLAAHEGDGYYLGTPYGNTGPGTGGPVDQWSCRYPNGRPNPGTGTAYMNCAGFVSAVITDAGGDVSAIANYVNPETGYRRGNDTNASKWQGWTEHNAVEMYEFGTKEEMLASGVLQRGDIIYMHPFSFEGDDDAHIGFFWGSTSSEDLFWHSSSHGDGLVAGSQPGNMISRITPKSPVKYYRVIKVRHTATVTFQKASSIPAVDTTGTFYSLAGARYDIYRAADNVRVDTITTNAQGQATLTLPANTDYYAVEVSAPAGWTLNPERIAFNTGSGASVTLPEEPLVTISFQKVSSSPGVDVTDAYYSVAGARYNIYRADTDELVDTITTDERGQGTLKLEANTAYYAVETAAPPGFMKNPARISFNSSTGTAVSLPDAPHVTVTFSKVSTDATLTDGNSEYAYSGAVYEIHRASNDALAATVTTDAQGHASCKLEPNTAYYAVETRAPQGFVASSDRVSFTTGTGNSSVTLEDEPGSVIVSIQKRDAATGGAAQAGASLEGATYQLTDANGAVHTASTDANGHARFERIPLGTIRLVETAAPKGYRIDTTVHTYTVHAGQLTAAGTYELAPADDFVELPVAFDLDIVKYADSGSETSGLQDPAAGVRFDIISNSTQAVVGSITTDESGRATTAGQWFGAGMRVDGIAGALPYDAAGYTVREDPSTTPAGYRPAGAWQVTTEQMVDGATLHYIVDNDFVASRIQLVKVDAETGMTVPAAGFTFQLLNEDRQPISQDVWYPNHAELTSFTTDETGMVTFPAALKPGTYYIRETAAAAPYLVTQDDLRVVIEDDADVPPVTVVRVSDDEVMGQARITKTCTTPDGASGEHVHDAGCAGALAGAAFDVVAQDDVVSPDGTVRAVAGAIVDHVVTSDDGTATTKELYLGAGTATYAFVETEAPAGHVLDPTPHEVTLSYADDQTPLVTATVTADNAPTETILNKTVLGHDDVLPGATFLMWSADDEVSLAPDEGAAAIAIDADEGTEVTMQPAIDHAQLVVDAAEGYRLQLTAEDGAALVAADGMMIAPGTYEAAVLDASGAALDEPALDPVTIEANHTYRISISDSFFFGLHAGIEGTGELAGAEAVPYDADAGAHVRTDVPAGTYLVRAGDAAQEVTLAAGETLVATDTLAQRPVLLADDAAPVSLTTDDTGQLVIRHLAEGSYRLWEQSAPGGFLTDQAVRYFTVDRNGRTEGMPSYAIDMADDYTKVDLSKRDITNEAEVPGAELAVLDADGNTIDAWTSEETPHRIEALAPGDYQLVELRTPHDYDEATAVAFTVMATGAVQRATLYDEPIRVTGEIDKRQTIAEPTHPYTEADATVEEGGKNNAPVQQSDDGSYAYTIDFRSTSSTWVDEFTVTDSITAASAGLATLTGITTPVAAEDYDGLMNVWFTTNRTDPDAVDASGANATLSDGHENPWLSDPVTAERLGDDGRVLDYTGWRLWASDVPTDTAIDLNVADLGLADGEIVTAVRFEYGCVEAGFTSRSNEDDWTRGLLKNPHDDREDAHASEAELAPAVLRLCVTDRYQAGTVLENAAQVDLFRNGGSLEPHEQLEDHDEDQVQQEPHEQLPVIGTTLTDDADGDHVVDTGTVTLVDTVSYQGIEPGLPHTLHGTLMNRETGEPLCDAEGNAITASTTFTPTDAGGTADVTFELDTSDLDGSALVAFEQLTYTAPATPGTDAPSDGEEDHGAEIVVARHEDINDHGQTVTVKQTPDTPAAPEAPDTPDTPSAATPEESGPAPETPAAPATETTGSLPQTGVANVLPLLGAIALLALGLGHAFTHTPRQRAQQRAGRRRPRPQP